MSTEEVRSYLSGLKSAIRQMEDWTHHARELIHELEEDLMDQEDARYYQKYILNDSMQKRRKQQPASSLRRQKQSHCHTNGKWLDTFAQELNQINKNILQKV